MTIKLCNRLYKNHFDRPAQTIQNMFKVNQKMLCFIGFLGFNGVTAAKDYQAHHRSGYEHAHPVDESQVNVSMTHIFVKKVVKKQLLGYKKSNARMLSKGTGRNLSQNDF